MILKDYQTKVVDSIKDFFKTLEKNQSVAESLPDAVRNTVNYVGLSYDDRDSIYQSFKDRPRTGTGNMYPRVCIKIPTGGGKTLLAVEAIRAYQSTLAKKRTGLIVWITHRDQIYRQTLEHLQDKTHIYRQMLDQVSGNRTLVLEKGQRIRKQDVEQNLVILMLMIQSTNRTDYSKLEVFKDNGGFTDFFPEDNRFDEHKKLIDTVPNLDIIPNNIFGQTLVKTSLGNVVRVLNPLFIVDEFHRMWSDRAQNTLNGLNPSLVFGLSATPKDGMNILYKVSGRQLEREEMIKLDLHLFPPATNGNWREMIDNVKARRESLEQKADELKGNEGTYIRPIALFQVERTGKDQRGTGFVHSEDVREYLQNIGTPKDQIKVKSSAMDEIKEEKLLSLDSEVRYIITKEALSEGWDCSFAYILGIIPNSQSNTSMTQLIGRILRQPYASKTTVRELNESYVYFTEGDTQQVLQKIKQGFEEEGLGDLIAGILPNGGGNEITNPPRQVSIKQSILKNNPESLYLPQWIVKDGTTHRKLVYEIDIKPRIDWSKPNYTQWIEDTLIPSIGRLANIPQEIIYGLEGVVAERDSSEMLTQGFDIQYIARRVSEIVENPFVAYEITQRIVSEFIARKSKNELDKQSGFIANEFVKYLELYKDEQETIIFNQLADGNIITLALSSDPKIGFELPRKDWLIPSEFDMPYKNSLYEKVDVKSLNSLEMQVAGIIDNQTNVLWWTRNKVGRSWYSIQGWHKNKVRPDFIVARKTEDNHLEIVYVIESKGEQLLGNKDTQYKENLFTLMNNQKDKIDTIQTNTLKYKLNDKFQFEFIEQRQEESAINLLFNSNPII